MNDGSVYYGEIAHVTKDTEDLCHNFPELPEDQKSKYRTIRNGYGIQLFGRTESGVLCFYAGQWAKDKKSGLGLYNYSDGSKYQGSFKDDLYEEYGQLEYKADNVSES